MSDFSAEPDGSIPPPPRPIELQDVDERGWWLLILVGFGLVAIGVWLLTNLFESVTVLALLVGVSLVVGGIAEAAALGGRGGLGWVGWLSGGLAVAAGAVVLAWPDITLWVLAVLAGAGLVVAGLVRIAVAFEGHRTRPDWPIEAAVGALGVVLGAIVLAWPDATLVVLALLLGVRAVATGLVSIGVGWRVHRLAH